MPSARTSTSSHVPGVVFRIASASRDGRLVWCAEEALKRSCLSSLCLACSLRSRGRVLFRPGRGSSGLLLLAALPNARIDATRHFRAPVCVGVASLLLFCHTSLATRQLVPGALKRPASLRESSPARVPRTSYIHSLH